MIRFLKGFYQYNQEDCGAACLATILNFYGKKTTISILRNKMLYDKNGANALSIIETAKKYGLEGEAYEGSFEELNAEIIQNNFKLPLILHLEKERIGGHYVVLKKIKSNGIKVFDPKKGHLVLTKEEFLNQWTGIVICFENLKSIKKSEDDIILSKSKHRYLKILLEQKNIFILAIILSILISLVSILGSWAYKIIIDEYIAKDLGSNNTASLTAQYTLIFLNLLVFYILQSGVLFGRDALIGKVTQKISNKLSRLFLSHFLNIPEKSLFYFESGEILARFQSIAQIQESSLKIIFTLSTELIGICLGAIILIQLSSELFLWVIFMLFIYILIFLIGLPFLSKIRKKYYSFYSESMTELNQAINGRSTILMQNRNTWFLNKIFNKVKDTHEQLFKLGITEAIMTSLVTITESIGGLAILWKGSLLVLSNTLSLGSLIVFQSMLAFFISPVQRLVLIQNEFQNLNILIQRLDDIFVIKSEVPLLPICENKKVENYSIKVSNVAFSYYYSENIFENISFEIHEGYKIGVIGASGCGKTTLIKIIASLYTPTQGDISLNDKLYDSFSLKFIRDIIAYVPQDSFIMEGTITENLSMGKYLSQEEQLFLHEIAEIFGIYQFNTVDCNSLEMYVYENGCNLSGGQKQKIGLARAIMKKPKILLLDESLSNVDNKSKHRILQYLYSFNDLSIISISHDESVHKYSDQFLLFEDNKISLINKERI